MMVRFDNLFTGTKTLKAKGETIPEEMSKELKAQCDLEPAGCPIVWLLLMMSIALHVVRCCVYDSDYESDEDDQSEKSTMYT